MSPTIFNNLNKKNFKFASTLESEFMEWINSPCSKRILSDLSEPIVMEALRFLSRIKEKHPEGISKTKLGMEFIQANSSKYVAPLLSLAKIYQEQGSIILKPFAQIFSNSDIFPQESKKEQINTTSVKETVRQIENAFKDYLAAKVKDPSAKQISTKKQRLTKREKQKRLFLHLVEEFNNEMVSILNYGGLNEIADAVASDKMFFLDVNKLKKMRLTDSIDYDRSHMVRQAEDVAKTILKRIEPEDYEYNYNLLINSAMWFNMNMSDEDYNRFFSEWQLAKGRGEQHIPRFNFPKKEYVHPTFIEFIALVFQIIKNSINF